MATASHLLLKFGTKGGKIATAKEAYALLDQWKAEAGSDEFKFAELVRAHSECDQTAAKGGALGFVFRGTLPPAICDVVFSEDPGRTYGPVATKEGVHLVYVHFCGTPRGEDTGIPASWPRGMADEGLQSQRERFK